MTFGAVLAFSTTFFVSRGRQRKVSGWNLMNFRDAMGLGGSVTDETIQSKRSKHCVHAEAAASGMRQLAGTKRFWNAPRERALEDSQ